jgi:hypothetical protein
VIALLPRSSKPSDIGGSLSFVMPAADTDTSDFAMERQGSGRPFQREATAGGMLSGKLILVAELRLKVPHWQRSSTHPPL